MFYLSEYSSLLGAVTLACDEYDNLIGLWFKGQKYYKRTIFGDVVNYDTPYIVFVKKWLDGYFAGKRPSISELKLLPSGSDFYRTVWGILCEIPYGKVVTYGDVAKKIAEKTGIERMSAQAVGGAVGHNPISIIIPCHRVVGANGSLTGYAGGIDKKAELLKFEGVDISRFYIPKKGTAL